MTILKFSGHQSFSFRNSWLTKGIFHLNKYPDLFKRDDALVILGVGKNMVSSIRYWCTVCQLITSQKINNKNEDVITEIGSLLFLNDNKAAWDPYLEDIGTLWLIHYLFVTNDNFYTTAYHVFNHLSSSQFTKNELLHQLQALTNKYGTRISPNTIIRDINTFIHTYVGNLYEVNQSDYEDALDCPLKELRLISHNSGEDLFFIDRDPKSTLPDGIFLFALQDFVKELTHPTISVEELHYSPKSPGRVFRLDETSLVDRLERIDKLSKGKLVLSKTAGIRQLFIKEPENPINYLNQYYSQSMGGQ